MAIKTIMFISIPSAVGMTVLSRPIVWLLYNTNTDSIRLGGRLIYFHDFHRFVEKGGKDELGFIISSRILKEPLKLDVLEFVQTESVIIRMKF